MSKFITIVLFLFLGFNGYSQLTKGLIIKGNDTIKVKFKVPENGYPKDINYSIMQRKLIAYDEHGEKYIIRPEKTDEVQLFYKNEIIRMLKRVDPSPQVPCDMCLPKYIFLKLLVDGKMKLFEFYYSTKGKGTVALGLMSSAASGRLAPSLLQSNKKNCYYYYQKDENQLFGPTLSRIDESIKENFSDCELLLNKIDSEEKDTLTPWGMVKFYNANCRK